MIQNAVSSLTPPLCVISVIRDADPQWRRDQLFSQGELGACARLYSLRMFQLYQLMHSERDVAFDLY